MSIRLYRAAAAVLGVAFLLSIGIAINQGEWLPIAPAMLGLLVLWIGLRLEGMTATTSTHKRPAAGKSDGASR